MQELVPSSKNKSLSSYSGLGNKVASVTITITIMFVYQVLEYNNVTSVTESNFNASLPTKVIIHGFGSSCTKVWAREMRLSFLAVVGTEY